MYPLKTISVIVFSLLWITSCNLTNKKNTSSDALHWMYLGKQTKNTFIKVVKDTYIDLHFNKEGGLAGNAGCNTYHCNFTENKQKATIALNNIALTQMLCTEKVLKQEDNYISLLKQVSKKQIKNGKLYLYISNDSYLLFKDISNLFKPM